MVAALDGCRSTWTYPDVPHFTLYQNSYVGETGASCIQRHVITSFYGNNIHTKADILADISTIVGWNSGCDIIHTRSTAKTVFGACFYNCIGASCYNCDNVRAARNDDLASE